MNYLTKKIINIIFYAGLITFSVHVVLTLTMIIINGSITYTEPNNYYLYPELIFSIIILIVVCFKYLNELSIIKNDNTNNNDIIPFNNNKIIRKMENTSKEKNSQSCWNKMTEKFKDFLKFLGIVGLYYIIVYIVIIIICLIIR